VPKSTTLDDYAGPSRKQLAMSRYHGVELGQVSCDKQTHGCGI